MPGNEVEIIVTSKDKSDDGFKSADKGANKLGDSLKRVGETATGFIAANVVGAGIAAVGDFLSGAVEASSNLSESMNAVSKIFGSSQQKILDWGKNTANSFGLSQRAFNDLAVPLGAGLRNAGIPLDKVADQTINLTKRAADMASVFNTSVPEALEAIQAGLRGEADPLERFGVGLSAAATQTEALAETHKKNASALTNTELATARVNLIMKQTASTAGDFTSTSGQLANAQRIAAAKTEELQAKLGDKLKPIVLEVTKAKLALVGVVTDKVLPVLDRFAAWASKNQGTVKLIAIAIGVLLVGAFIAWAVSAAMAAAATIAATWPILAIIAAIGLLTAGVIYAYTHWAWFRTAIHSVGDAAVAVWHFFEAMGAWFAGPFVNFFVSAWHAVENGYRAAHNAIINGLHAVVNVALGVLDWLLSAAVKAFGWVPGIGGQLKQAKKDFDEFRAGVNDALDAITKNVSIKINTYVTGNGAKLIENQGTSIVVGQGNYRAQAAGGLGGGLTVVGEHGWELADLPQGTNMIPHGTAKNIVADAMAGGGDSGGYREVRFTGDTDSAFAVAFMRLLREKKIIIT